MNIIYIYGASGSGTSTLGSALSNKIKYKFIETDDYIWVPTNPMYTTLRPIEERKKLLKNDIEKYQNVVISGTLSKFGAFIIPDITLAIRLFVPTEVRINRIKEREYLKFGERILKGGDMYKTHEDFINWASKYDTGDINMRSKASHDLMEKQLKCKILKLDGTKEINDLVDTILYEMNILKLR